MRFFFVVPIMVCVFTNFLQGQTMDELAMRLDSLNLILKEVDQKIHELEKTQNQLQMQISFVNQQKRKLELEKTQLEGIAVVISAIGGTLRDAPSASGKEIIKLSLGDTIYVFDLVQTRFFRALYDGHAGYISSNSFRSNEKIDLIVNQRLKEENPRLARLRTLYGFENAQKILQKRYWIGMTAGMARESLGSPDSVNRSTGSWGVSEQWTYREKGIYLYFTNGELTSIMD